MRVLVLGANGFVGRNLVRALAATGWATPIASGRRASPTANGIESITLDARNETELTKALSNADALVNCVTGDAESIIANAQALFSAAAKAGKPVVYLSSMAVYGSATGLISEDAPLLGDLGAYSAAKVRAESLVPPANTGSITILRPGCIYGSESPQWTQRIARLLREKRVGDLGSAGDGCTNLVHVNDVVRAILASLQQARPGVNAYNLAMPDSPDWNTYLFRFAKRLGAVPIKRISDKRLRIEAKLAIPLKIAEKFAGSSLPPAITPSLLHTWRQTIRLNSSKASDELGISWTSLDDGLSEAVAGASDARSRARVSS